MYEMHNIHPKCSYCFQDVDINLFFSDRATGDDDLFVGQATLSFLIQCNELPDTGVTRDATNQLGVT